MGHPTLHHAQSVYIGKFVEMLCLDIRSAWKCKIDLLEAREERDGQTRGIEKMNVKL